jgi:ABC-type transport system involved in multi-copper enzyme maturation permease subunit
MTAPAFLLAAVNIDHVIWIVAAVIVIGGLAVFGLEDVRRASIARIWAISSVCFAESIRRKVLWVIPLAILGVIAVSVLQHSLDPQETIRQTIKFCLFASSLIITLTALILAATNLPREIENRVIFTIVTKPTTRLEIVLGKVVGFARMSGLIMIIMGVFTFAYLAIENHRLGGQIAERLKTETDDSNKRALQAYQEAGLLSTKSLGSPSDLEVYEHTPSATGTQWLTGAYGYSYIAEFNLTDQDKALLESAASDPNGKQVLAISTMKLKRPTPNAEDQKWVTSRKLPVESHALGPALPGEELVPMPIPQLTVRILDEGLAVLVPDAVMNGGKMASAQGGIDPKSTAPYILPAGLPNEAVRKVIQAGHFFIQVVPETNSVEYEVNQTPTVLDIFDGTADHVIKSSGPPRFISMANRYGMKIVGNSKGEGSVAVFRFNHVEVPSNLDEPVVFRFRGGVEHTGEFDASKPWSEVALTVINRESGESSGQIRFHPETNHDYPVPVPGKYVKGGNFSVELRGMDDGQMLGMSRTAVQLISAAHSFALNLLASLLILWLMSILVVVIAIFCSTFLSWPIAIVLTLLLLLGHWGVAQLGDTLTPGVGRNVASDLGMQDPTQLTIVSSSVDALAKVLMTVAAFLPDLSKFPVMEDITRGVAIPPGQIIESLGVLLCYGLPMVVISYIILKNKEVAP